jgi:hypothetical protein
MCRFNTRIDYIYVDSSSVADGVRTAVDYYYACDAASDHDMIVAPCLG